MKNSYDVSGVAHTAARSGRKVSGGLSSIWRRVSWPVMIGQYWGATESSDKTQHIIDLRSIMPWNTLPAVFSGRPEPQKSTWIAMDKDAATELDNKHRYIAICSPINIRDQAYERSLLLPLIRVW